MRTEALGLVDRNKPLSFRFNGRRLTGFEGDTLASALLANGVHFVGRSFKYHRPRGVLSAGHEEPNALVRIVPDGGEPNVRATTLELYDGLEATSQNAWPSLRVDARAAFDAAARFLPAGFYYKTFMWPDWSWFEGPIRRTAGLGVAPDGAGEPWHTHRYAHCDLLIAGGGPAGLAAALAAAESGARVMLCEQDAQLGGSLLWQGGRIEGEGAADFAAGCVDKLKALGVEVLTRTQVSGAYEHGFYTAVQRLNAPPAPAAAAADRPPAQRLWKIRARAMLVATGAIERPLVFPNNDRPGVMLARAAEEYLFRYGVRVGSRAVLAVNNDAGLRTALRLHDGGLEIAAVVDPRPELDGALGAALAEAGIAHHRSASLVDTQGRFRVRQAVFAALDGSRREAVDCDCVLMSGGLSPTVHLLSQAGGKLVYDEALAAFRPNANRMPVGVAVAGAANGTFDLSSALEDGWEAGRRGARELGAGSPRIGAPRAEAPAGGLNLMAIWRTPGPPSGRRQWVDFQNDVTAKDVDLAAREGYRSVELLKRYTTTGMATDQGKTSNVNALALLAEATHTPIPDVGTTTFRPPYAPVAFGAIAGPYSGELARPYRYMPCHEEHDALGAGFMDASGWLRPELYPRAGEAFEETVTREMRAARSGVGLFDASPLGKLLVTGPDAGRLLDFLYVGRASNLKTGRVRYGLMASEHGIAFDDGVFARLDENRFWVSPSSGMAEAVAAAMEEWLQCEWTDWRVTVQCVTSAYASIVLAGPAARRVLQMVGTDIDLSPDQFAHMSVRQGSVAGQPAQVFRVSFTGEMQYEINVPARHGPALWRACMKAGESENVMPIGIEAWMRLRIEKGYIHIGSDSDGTTSPDDLGFTHWRKKEADFLGRRSLLRPHFTDPEREQLVGLRGLDPALRLPVGAHILPEPGVEPPLIAQGRVTSSTISSCGCHSLALALLKRGRDRLGETVEVLFENRRFSAQVVSPVFYDPEGERLNA